LQTDPTAKRPSILQWKQFIEIFSKYWNVEKPERKELILGNAKYYSDGELPACVPALHAGLPGLVVCETVAGDRVVASAASADSKGGKKGSR